MLNGVPEDRVGEGEATEMTGGRAWTVLVIYPLSFDEGLRTRNPRPRCSVVGCPLSADDVTTVSEEMTGTTEEVGNVGITEGGVTPHPSCGPYCQIGVADSISSSKNVSPTPTRSTTSLFDCEGALMSTSRRKSP